MTTAAQRRLAVNRHATAEHDIYCCRVNKEPVIISGAGPAGMAAAITLARAGRCVSIYERHRAVGSRFHGDLQGLENWTTAADVTDELAGLGLGPGFSAVPFHEAVLFDPQGGEHRYRSPQPMAYIVRRGDEDGALDRWLKEEALAAGVEFRFGEVCRTLPEGGIEAGGPHGAHAIGIGYLFDTEMADGAYIALSDRLAPKGYAYLLIQGGRGTLMSWMYDDFHNERRYLDRCEAFFQSRVGLDMKNRRRTGGAAGFYYPRTACKGRILYVGESAGFQDALWGFGMRYALLSGHLAARALLSGRPGDYDCLWRERLGRQLQAGLVNRWFYQRLGERGYNALLSGIDRALREKPDGRNWLHGYTAPRFWKSLCFPLIWRRYRARLKSAGRAPDRSPADCVCTWCRCRRKARRD